MTDGIISPSDTTNTKGSVPPPSLATKISYGFGAIAYGVKDNGFGFFLLIFYSQVLGVDARLIGLAMTIALFLDALSDPVVGYWSDNFRSKWGRRHPFMYASALPVAASFFLLWNPPEGWSDMALFWYVLVISVLIRTCITFYETPSSALAPELSDNYDQRSGLLSLRYFFGWTGGNLMAVIMFVVLFPAFVTPTIPNGQFNKDAYSTYGLIASGLIFVAIMVSALGTHRRIAHLKAPPPKRSLSIGLVFKEIFETLANRSFIALFLAAIFGSIASGLSASMTFYFTSFFWGFTPQQTGLLTISVFVSAILGAVMAPIVTKSIGKKQGAMIIGLVAFLGAPLPIVLRLLGVMPENGDPSLFWIVMLANMVDTGLIICFQILSASMLADLVEDAEIKTGRRSEGIFFAASTFIRKSVQGLGVITAGFVLAAAQFPAGVKPDQIPEEALTRLGLYYVPTILFLWLTMLAIMSTYRLKREDHENNLRELASRQSQAVD
ncbi:MAG TPA: sugar transporter [Hyphomonadaceae bacterium]|nr:sugar transporter [Hyphomonadaceae bacterium UKL13-1]OYU53300.1 MAG: sugar transporter [Alphaproteobacteria bacterium PA1]HCP65803.1 sugar transporter [Hyphomonadaceae bacterium]